MTADPFLLARFVEAQDKDLGGRRTMFDVVREELAAGQKRSHWVWYIFPQLKGLGRSPLATHYGIGSAAEAAAYLEHPVLGSRLRDCVRLVLAVDRRLISEILPGPDDTKFRSCLTLFAQVSGEAVFREALEKYFPGGDDSMTLSMLRDQE